MNKSAEPELRKSLVPSFTEEQAQLSRRRYWRWLILALILGAALYWAYRHFGPAGTPPANSTNADAAKGRGGGPNDPSRPTPVVVAPARKGDIHLYIDGLGTVIPVRTVTVKTRIDGELVRVLFKEGQMVSAGDLLAEVDPRPYQVQLTQMEGQLARDQALLANARLDLERYRTLFAQDSVAKQQLDTQGSLVSQYEGTVKMDQGQVDNVRLQLVYSRITAPLTGRIGLRQVDPGNIVHAADTTGLGVITQLQPITVVFTLAQDSLPAVMKQYLEGKRLPVDAYDREFKTRLASGALLSPDNQIDTTTGTVKIKAQFPNQENVLFPNQFVNARMLLDTQHDVTLIPSAAVQRGSQGMFVYVVKVDLTVTVRPVKLGASEGATTAVESGIAPGEQVVVDGMDRLREGARIELPGAARPYPPAANPSGPPGR